MLCLTRARLPATILRTASINHAIMLTTAMERTTFRAKLSLTLLSLIMVKLTVKDSQMPRLPRARLPNQSSALADFNNLMFLNLCSNPQSSPYTPGMRP